FLSCHSASHATTGDHSAGDMEDAFSGLAVAPDRSVEWSATKPELCEALVKRNDSIIGMSN
ncbi:hypothetical protein, partial [Cellulomonas iranensis]|uniref:hypothetical protein n=1 Tax=Cellulomonas iranensis TaxID=76862 RepID=UPI001C4E49E8